MKSVKNWLITGVGILLLTSVCRVVTDDEGGDQGLRNFKLEANEISGWTEFSCFDFNVSNCSNDAGLNGGSSIYVNEGLVEGFRQIMKTPDYDADIFIMDFGDNTKANNMFIKISGEYKNNKQPLGNFAESIAISEENGSGVNVCAHFGKFFFEIHFTGYLNKADARNTANGFIELFQNKFLNMK